MSEKRDLKNLSALCGDTSPGSTFNGLSHSIGVMVTNFVLNVKLDSTLRYGTGTSLLKADSMCVARSGLGILGP